MTRKAISGLLPAIAVMFASGPVLADNNDTWFGKRAPGQWYIGVKAGKVKNGLRGTNDASNKGLLVGYEFARAIGDSDGTASIELEATSTSDEGTFGPTSDLGTSGTWDASTLGLFMVYRTAGNVYFKVKGGVQMSNVNYHAPGATSLQTDDASLAGGVGLGVKVGDSGNVEVEYAGETGDNDLGNLSLSGHVRF